MIQCVLKGRLRKSCVSALMLLAAIEVAGCAGIDVVSIGDDDVLDKKATGFRYYQPAPFLFVYADGKGGVNSEIKYLPDVLQKMSIEPFAQLASIDLTLEFDAGLLKQASATADETVVPNAALDALAKVLGAMVAKELALPDEVRTQDSAVPAPYLFRILVSKGGQLTLVGEQGIDAAGNRPAIIRATVPKN